MDLQNNENEKNIISGLKDTIGSLIDALVLFIVNIFIKYFTGFGAILPNVFLLILCVVSAVLLLVAFNTVFNKFGLKYVITIKYIVCVLIIGIAFVSCINLLSILVKICELNKITVAESYDVIYNTIIDSVRYESLFVIVLCLFVIIYLWIGRRYIVLDNKSKKEIIDQEREKINKEIKNTTTMMSSAVTDNFNNFSKTSAELMKKLEFNTAMTSTIIPFYVDKEKGILQTYLITNTSYPEYTWMFPGGHIKFDENESPESVAKLRAKDEAGLDVALIDLYNSFDLLSEDETENRVSNMTVFNPPHYLYLFKLNENARCFGEKGHEYHIDAVYVGLVDRENPIKGANHRVYIPLSLQLTTPEEVSQACYKAIRAYYKKYRVKSSEQQNIPDYVEKMLYAAYKDFVSYIEKRGGDGIGDSI